MGIFSKFRKSLAETIMPGQIKADLDDYFKMIDGYTPTFKTRESGLYEMELTRSCIHSFATHFSKFDPKVTGASPDAARVQRILANGPNPLQDTTKFLYRIATLLMVYNTVFIVPIESRDGMQINGFWALDPSGSEIKERGGKLYLVYQWYNTGERLAIELDRVGIMTQMQLNDPFYGASNTPLAGTLEVLETQQQGIVEGIKSGAAIRFMAQMDAVVHKKSMEEERKRLTEVNFTHNNGGVLLFDQKYASIKQVKNDRYVIDAAQQDAIRESVFTYFGTNKAILQNNFNNVQWTAYYEGKLEAPIIQLGNVLTSMVFSSREMAANNKIVFSVDQAQYQTPEQKVTRAVQLFDRGMMSINDARNLFALDPVEGGDELYIRREYMKLDESKRTGVNDEESGTEDNAGETVPSV